MRPFVLLALALNALVVATRLPAASWPALDRSEFAYATSPIDPEAGAEVLLREAVITHHSGSFGTVAHFVRYRIYTEQGVRRLSKIELPYRNRASLSGIEARTIKPDGKILELARKDIFDREVMRSGNVRLQVKSFAPPGLEAGVIMEYRYTENFDAIPALQILPYQSDLPTRLCRYKLWPLPYPGWSLKVLHFNAPQRKSIADSQGYYTYQATDLPARKEEPFQLPAVHIQPVALAYYAFQSKKDAGDHWQAKGAELYDDTESAGKPSKALTAAVVTLVAPDDSQEVRLRKLYDFCRTEILHRNRDTSALTREQRAKLPVNKHATDTLQNRGGNARDIDTLFLALARAAGFDARFALCNDRSKILFMREMMESFALPDRVVAVRLDGTWRFFNPSKRYLPFGALDWQNSYTRVLVADPKNAAVETIEGLAAAATSRVRSGTFTLSPDGTLEGDVTLTYSGYWEAQQKEALDALSAEECARRLTDEVRENLKRAELTEVTVENADQPLAPLKIRYHVRIPDFAERTGSRLFFPLAVFHKNAAPLFEAATRKSDILFRHRYTEKDEFVISPPEGFSLEAASAPGDVPMGGLGAYTTRVSVGRTTGNITYVRNFALESMYLPASKYVPLKTVFDQIHRYDNHLLTLKRTAADDPPTAETTAPAATAPSL